MPSPAPATEPAAAAQQPNELTDTPPLPEGPVLLFDGVCNLCDRTVNFILRHDRRGELLLAPLQSNAAERLLAGTPLRPADLRSLILVDHGRVWLRSRAVMEVGKRMGGPWKLLGLLGHLLPRPLRDALYDWVARNRYRWFGRRDSCRMATPAERERFLE